MVKVYLLVVLIVVMTLVGCTTNTLNTPGSLTIDMNSGEYVYTKNLNEVLKGNIGVTEDGEIDTKELVEILEIVVYIPPKKKYISLDEIKGAGYYVEWDKENNIINLNDKSPEGYVPIRYSKIEEEFFEENFGVEKGLKYDYISKIQDYGTYMKICPSEGNKVIVESVLDDLRSGVIINVDEERSKEDYKCEYIKVERELRGRLIVTNKDGKVYFGYR